MESTCNYMKTTGFWVMGAGSDGKFVWGYSCRVGSHSAGACVLECSRGLGVLAAVVQLAKGEGSSERGGCAGAASTHGFRKAQMPCYMAQCVPAGRQESRLLCCMLHCTIRAGRIPNGAGERRPAPGNNPCSSRQPQLHTQPQEKKQTNSSLVLVLLDVTSRGDAAHGGAVPIQ